MPIISKKVNKLAEFSTQIYNTRDEVDFVIVGSGAAGGILAKELAEAGHSVVILEQGPHLKAADFRHDEWGYKHNHDLTWSARRGNVQTFRRNSNEEASQERRCFAMRIT